MVVNGDGESLLGLFLSDDVLVEERLDLDRLGQPDAPFLLLGLTLLGDDVQTDIDTLVADVHRRSGDQLPDVSLALVAKRALEPVVVVLLARHQLPRPVGRRPRGRFRSPRLSPAG